MTPARRERAAWATRRRARRWARRRPATAAASRARIVSEGFLALRDAILELRERDIVLRDMGRGLVDFPAMRDGREVYLCWEEGEPRSASGTSPTPVSAGAARSIKPAMADPRVARAQRGFVRAWRGLSFEQRVAAVGALLLIVSTFGPFSFVEGAVVLVALAVLALLRARGLGAEFQLPFGDGAVIAAAGAWAGLLIAIRIFDRPLGLNLLALACAAILVVAGLSERAKRPPPELGTDTWDLGPDDRGHRPHPCARLRRLRPTTPRRSRWRRRSSTRTARPPRPGAGAKEAPGGPRPRTPADSWLVGAGGSRPRTPADSWLVGAGGSRPDPADSWLVCGSCSQRGARKRRTISCERPPLLTRSRRR